MIEGVTSSARRIPMAVFLNLDGSCYFFFQAAPQTHYVSENLVAPGIEPGPLDLATVWTCVWKVLGSHSARVQTVLIGVSVFLPFPPDKSRNNHFRHLTLQAHSLWRWQRLIIPLKIIRNGVCCHLLGYNDVQSACEPTFRRNVSPSPSWSKINQTRNLVHSGFLLCWFSSLKM
jgi:hypothetical protein